MIKLCLNCIVKNEADKIERMLKSVAPYISNYAIVDTGSTDDTIEKIQDFLTAKGIEGTVRQTPFENFEQARNDALALARGLNYQWDYLLLCDADMELLVDDPNFKSQLKGGLGYDVIQRAGGLSYHNRRFVSRNAIGKYRGVTHEFLDVPGEGVITGISFLDHADGTNRKDKYKRDIRLLKKALHLEPNNDRYWYYLGQSYRDAGRPERAAHAYQKRIQLGGWDEEVWSARVNYAHCLREQGNEAGFVRELMEAYNFRPSRAEALYDLAKHYREKGMNFAALTIAEEGMRIPYPTDVLFVQDYVYSTGLKEEFSIAAFYDKTRRERGASVCNDLILSPTTEWDARELARNNMFHYIEPLSKYAPSFSAKRLCFDFDGFTSMNPSIANVNGDLKAVVRGVNYRMDDEGRYLIKGTDGEANSTNPIHTRNRLITINQHTLDIISMHEILPPEGFPAPAYDLVVGFEDMRLFAWDGELWASSTVREQNAEGWCEQTLARISADFRLTDVKPLRPPVRSHEKNWMPWVLKNDNLRFVYRLGKTVDPYTLTMCNLPVPFNTDALSGGSQVIPFRGAYICLVHEARYRPGTNKRYYQHRFVLMNPTTGVTDITPPFYFHDRVIEFAAGLAWHPDNERLLISYGREDKEAWLATVDWHDIAGMFHA